MTHPRPRFVIAAVAVLIGGSLLAGCASDPSTKASTRAPSSAPSSPTSQPPAPTAPSFVFGLSCAELLPLADVQSDVTAPVRVQLDETTAPRNGNEVSIRQLGGADCVWGGDARTDGGWNDGATVTALPDAADAYDAWTASKFAVNDGCSGGRCQADFVVKGAWIEVYLSDSRRSDAAGGMASKFQAIVTGVTARLTAATLTPPWKAPVRSLQGVSDCAARANAMAGVIGAGPTTAAPDAPQLDIGSVAGARAGMTLCRWNAASGSLDWSVVPGGGWAFGPIAARPPQPGLVETLRPVTVAGTDAAFIGCGDACLAYLDVKGSFVAVTLDSGLSDSTVIDLAAKAVAVLATS